MICECFYNGEWILVDPTCKRFQTNYDIDVLLLTYKIGGSSEFVPYLRDIDLGAKQTIKEHNREMDDICLRL